MADSSPATPEITERWLAFVEAVRDRLGMFVGRATYDRACALLVGFDEGVGGNTLRGFGEWLTSRAPDRPELAFGGQVLREAFPADDTPGSDAFDERQERLAIDALFELLSGFLADPTFEADWAAAREHLQAVASRQPLPDDVRKIVDSFLAGGFLVSAFQWLVRAAEDEEFSLASEPGTDLARAAAALRQTDWPRWVRLIEKAGSE